MTTIIKQAKPLYNLPRIVHLLEQEKWTWAKTMPGIPHEYIVRGKCQMGKEDFLMIVHAQRDLGKYEVWENVISLIFIWMDISIGQWEILILITHLKYCLKIKGSGLG